MSDLDAKLESLWPAERPPVRDAVFRIALLERHARRRLWQRMTGVGAAAVALTGAIVTFAPGDTSGAASGDAFAAALGGLSLLWAVWALSRLRRPI
jgi:membrane associated rhomboid family serine protease